MTVHNHGPEEGAGLGYNESRYTCKATCKNTNCPNDFFPDKWGKMEATRKGWFLQKNGDAWCPDHIPDWVEEWRAKKRNEGV